MSKNTKILVVGDPHFKCNNKNETTILHKKTISLIKERKPDAVVILGDTLHTHERINMSCLIRANDYFLDIRNELEHLNQNAELFVLIGNHDRPNNEVYLTKEHPFNGLKEWKGVNIIDVPIEKVINRHKFLFVPYVAPGRFLEACKTITNDFSEYRAIFAHQEFGGADIGCITSEVEEYDDNLPLCISGHIHKYQCIGSNLVYVGTPFQHTFGEDINKGLTIYTFGGGKIDQERIKIEEIGLKISITMSCEEFRNYDVPNDNNYYRIEIYGDDAELKTVKSTTKHRDLLANKNIKIIYTNVTFDNEGEQGPVQCNVNFAERLKNHISSLGEKESGVADIYKELYCI